MPDELKLCPFCSSEVDDYTETDAGIICGACEAKILSISTKQWNTRPIEDALRIENERLKTLTTFAPAYKEALSAIDMFIAENAKLKAEVRSMEERWMEERFEHNLLQLEYSKLKARVEAAEEMIEAQEYFDAAVGLPECWSDKKEYERDLEKTMTRLRAAREKWGEVSK